MDIQPYYIKPYKVIHVYNNKYLKRQYQINIFIGNVPNHIKTILLKIQDPHR